MWTLNPKPSSDCLFHTQARPSGQSIRLENKITDFHRWALTKISTLWVYVNNNTNKWTSYIVIRGKFQHLQIISKCFQCMQQVCIKLFLRIFTEYIMRYQTLIRKNEVIYQHLRIISMLLSLKQIDVKIFCLFMLKLIEYC